MTCEGLQGRIVLSRAPPHVLPPVVVVEHQARGEQRRQMKPSWLHKTGLAIGCLAFFLLIFALSVRYADQSKTSLINIYRALSPGISQDAAIKVYKERRSLFMRLRKEEGGRWTVFDPVTIVDAQNWVLVWGVTTGVLYSVSMEPFSLDAKTPKTRCPDKMLPTTL